MNKFMVAVDKKLDGTFKANTVEIIANLQNRVNCQTINVASLDTISDIIINKAVTQKYNLELIIESTIWGMSLINIIVAKLNNRGYDFDHETGVITKQKVEDTKTSMDVLMDMAEKHQLLMTYTGKESGRGFGKSVALIKKAIETDAILFVCNYAFQQEILKIVRDNFDNKFIDVRVLKSLEQVKDFKGSERGTKFLVDEHISNEVISYLIDDCKLEFIGGFNSLKTSLDSKKPTLKEILNEEIEKIKESVPFIADKEEMILNTMKFLKTLI